MKKTFSVFFILFLFFCGNIFSQSNVDNSQQSQSFSINTDPSQIQLNVPVDQETPVNQLKGPSTFGLFVRMIFALAVVAGIAYLVFYFLKKSTKINNDNDPFLRKVSQITLSPGKSVQVVTLQDNAFLIGVSDENINLIGKIEDKELVNAMNLYADKKENVAKPRSFREILDIFMPGSSKESDENVFAPQSSTPAEAIKQQRERLSSEEY